MYSGKRLFWHNCPQLLFVYKTVSQISFVDEIREKYLDGVREKNTLQLLVNKANTLNHSHKETDSLETWAVLIEIYKLCWNLPSSPKHRGSIKKTWLSLKGISSLQVTFVLIWMKQTLIWFNLQRDGTWNELSNAEDTFAESFQLHISLLHQSLCIFKAGLSRWYDG